MERLAQSRFADKVHQLLMDKFSSPGGGSIWKDMSVVAAHSPNFSLLILMDFYS